MSFFDDPTFFSPDNYQLCKIVRKFDEVNLTKRVLFEGELSLRPMSGLLTTKYFKIMDRKLVYFSEKKLEKPKGYYDLLSYMKISSYEFYDNEKKMHIYVFRLEKFGKFHEFFLKDRKITNRWIQTLKLYCISSDFDIKYELLEEIGSGHFAKVYKTIDKVTKYIYAAKILDKNKKFYDQKQFIFNEIHILKSLPKNDNIIKLFEVYESLSELILICEYMEGGDAYKRIKHTSDKKFSENLACFIFCQTLKALKFLHANGVVHRDIKPDNILLSDDSDYPICKLADFSLAEYYQKKKMTVQCGTPGYMSPEMFFDECYNEKIDIFSLGISLFIMLTGKSPFQGSNCEDVMLKNKNCIVKFKKKSWESISKEARKLTSRMISKFPGQRIALQQIFIQKWIKETFFDKKLNEILKDKLKNPKIHHPMKQKEKTLNDKEERKSRSSRLSLKKERKKSRLYKENPINSINSLFIGSFRSSNSSAIINMTTNSISSSLEIMRLRSGSFKCSSANSAYTLANIGNESDVENEEEKDYIVFDPNFLKKNGSKQTEGEKTYESTTNTLTTKMIFEDDNPVFLLMKSIIPFCSQVKHCKF